MFSKRKSLLRSAAARDILGWFRHRGYRYKQE